MKNLINRFVREEDGQDLVEYALLIAFVSLAAIAGMQALGGGINQKFSAISQSLNGS
jgi:pilus assembly protein Flp/PilA